jgi:hypothetical protein
LPAKSAAGAGLRTISLRPTSLPRWRMTNSSRVAASKTGDTRSCQLGMAMVTSETKADTVPAAQRFADIAGFQANWPIARSAMYSNAPLIVVKCNFCWR